MPPAIHIAGNDGVSLFKTCTAEVFRPIPKDESLNLHTSRSARTPPSTFLFLHLHLSNSPGSKNPSPVVGSRGSPLERGPPKFSLRNSSHWTTNDNRLASAVDSL